MSMFSHEEISFLLECVELFNEDEQLIRFPTSKPNQTAYIKPQKQADLFISAYTKLISPGGFPLPNAQEATCLLAAVLYVREHYDTSEDSLDFETLFDKLMRLAEPKN